jgi:two-component system response regulator
MNTPSSRCVLLVEDEFADAELIVEWVKEFGVCVVTALRAYEAITFLHRKDVVRPSLVLLDWKIPGGGPSVLQSVRGDPLLATTPVVVLSRSTADVDVRAAYAGHANAFVEKVSGLHDFRVRVMTICDFFLNMAQPPPPPADE